eukprot:m.163473 g.163473  ORF g.163473 m.163473 type:complete len:1510 (+) comp16391_c3_seq1:229-4758(+)
MSLLGEDDRDLAALASLTESTLVDALNQRFDVDRIYTYIGDILVAVNPFRPVDLYSPQTQAFYGVDAPSSHLDEPHTFAIANRAYRALCSFSTSQCIIVNGESGAGKTESAKQIASQLIFLCGAGSHGTTIEQRILRINPVLEAFGNAQTLMNDNSSRFGKYMELLFNAEGKLKGALLSEYLLEKSRVTRQAPGEQNFHVLYYVFAMSGAVDLGLCSPFDFSYLQASELEDTQDLAAEVEDALSFIGFSSGEIAQVKQLLASVLFLGNIEFEPSGDGVCISSASQEDFDRVASLLKLDAQALKRALIQTTAAARNEIITRYYDEEQAVDARDAMAKAIYSRLFSWLVYRINKILCPEDLAAAARVNRLEDLCKSIGILDIFGFEHFDDNGFEQWCINLANEQLQHFFNQHVFTLELEEYKREGVDASDVIFLDNTPILNMYLEKPLGLLSLLDEESVFPKATDNSLVAKFVRNFGKHEHFRPSLTNRPLFDIRHYAGDVTYSAKGFLVKNKDRLAADVITALQSSSLPVVCDLFFARITETGRLEPMIVKPTDGRTTINRKVNSAKQYVVGVSKRPPSVSQHFRNSLNQLVDKMQQCSPHFVRCIKPNTSKAPWIFENRYVTLQLRYTGVLDTIRIRREGYAWRPKFADFVKHFSVLAFAWNACPPPTSNSCLAILSKAGITSGYKVGHSKMFLKYFHKDTLLKCLEDFHTAARVLQKVTVGYMSRCRFRQFVSERNTQQQQVSAFLELLELLGEGTTAAVQAQSRQDDDKKHQRRREEEVRQQQEEEDRKEREKARVEAEKQLLEKIRNLEAERQAKSHETQEMLRRAKEEEERRRELEELLHAEQQRATELIQKQVQERVAAEEKLQQEHEKAQEEKQRREEAERFYAQQLQEEREAREQEQARLRQEHLKAQQEARDAETRASAELRQREEARLLEQKEFQTLIAQLGAARDKAEEQLRMERDEKEALALELSELKNKLKDTRAELAQEATAREEVESRLQELSEVISRESLMRTQAEETCGRLVEQNESLRKAVVEAEERILKLKDQLADEEACRRTFASKVHTLEKERSTARANPTSLAMPNKSLEEKQEQLQLYMDRLEALRCQARGTAKPGIDVNVAHLADHVKECLRNLPDQRQVAISKTRACGFLEKQGEVNASWRKRFFLLDLKKHALYYCTDETCTTVKGTIQVSEMLFVAPTVEEPTGFIIGTLSRNYVMRASTVECRDAWIEMVRVCLPETGRKLTSSEHVLQAEAVKAEYETRVTMLRNQVKRLEHDLDLEKIKRVDAEIRAQTALSEKEKAVKHRNDIQESYMAHLVTSAHQQKPVSTPVQTPAPNSTPKITPTVTPVPARQEPTQRAIIYEITRSSGRAPQNLLDKLDVRGYLQEQLGGNPLPTKIVIAQWGLQSHLVKLGAFMKTWKRRWFSLDLRQSTLTYYSDENSLAELGKLQLSDVCDVVIPRSLEAKASNTLLVVTPKRTFNLRADSSAIMLCWFHLLTAATVADRS